MPHPHRIRPGKHHPPATLRHPTHQGSWTQCRRDPATTEQKCPLRLRLPQNDGQHPTQDKPLNPSLPSTGRPNQTARSSPGPGTARVVRHTYRQPQSSRPPWHQQARPIRKSPLSHPTCSETPQSSGFRLPNRGEPGRSTPHPGCVGPVRCDGAWCCRSRSSGRDLPEARWAFRRHAGTRPRT